MSDTICTPRWKRLLDGRHTWGSVIISPTRYGVTRYRLVIFPPGMSTEDRMLLRAWRSWPTWGLAAWLVLEVVLVPIIGSGNALTISTAACLGPGLVIMAMTGANRGGIRTLSVVRMAGATNPIGDEQYVRLVSVFHQLTRADDKRSSGILDGVEYEAEVWRAYDRLAPAEPVRWS